MEGYNKLVLIALALAMTATTIAGDLTDDAEMEKCFDIVRETDSQLEDDGDELIEYANQLTCTKPVNECVREDQKVKSGVASMVEKVKQLGEANGCAEGFYRLGSQSKVVKREMASQIIDTIGEIKSVLDEMSERTLSLFQLILESLEAEAKKLEA